jgi:hypothetical protein
MPLLYCQNNVIRAGEFANCDVTRALLPPVYYRWPGGMDVTCTEGNEEKWFPSKEVQRFETRDAKGRSDAAQKNFNSSGEIRLRECLFI